MTPTTSESEGVFEKKSVSLQNPKFVAKKRIEPMLSACLRQILENMRPKGQKICSVIKLISSSTKLASI